jgi:hypothetical protein
MTKDSLNSAMKMQGYALFLMGDFPNALKKRMLYEMLNELEIKLPEKELRQLEKFYREKNSPKTLFAYPRQLSPPMRAATKAPPLRKPLFCSFCAGPMAYNRNFGSICLGCSKQPMDCTCKEAEYLKEEVVD